MSQPTQYEKPEIIVVEPTGQQKRYILKPHGDLEIIKKKWKSHLRNIGAKWVDKQRHWTIAKDNLKLFDNLRKVIDKSDKKEHEEKDSEHSSSSNSENDNSDDDTELIDYIKDRIKTARGNHPEIDKTEIEESDYEDVISLSRRVRYLYRLIDALRKDVKSLQDENALIYRDISKLKH
jgi:regulator of replication initiation timing